jgi:hypothetical protein
MTLEEQTLIARVQELRIMVQKFRMVGPGVTGNLNDGFNLFQPDTIDESGVIEDPNPDPEAS